MRLLAGTPGIRQAQSATRVGSRRTLSCGLFWQDGPIGTWNEWWKRAVKGQPGSTAFCVMTVNCAGLRASVRQAVESGFVYAQRSPRPLCYCTLL
jgi:hypothetical protein